MPGTGAGRGRGRGSGRSAACRGRARRRATRSRRSARGSTAARARRAARTRSRARSTRPTMKIVSGTPPRMNGAHSAMKSASSGPTAGDRERRARPRRPARSATNTSRNRHGPSREPGDPLDDLRRARSRPSVLTAGVRRLSMIPSRLTTVGGTGRRPRVVARDPDGASGVGPPVRSPPEPLLRQAVQRAVGVHGLDDLVTRGDEVGRVGARSCRSRPRAARRRPGRRP